jgi:hypothetical protein
MNTMRNAYLVSQSLCPIFRPAIKLESSAPFLEVPKLKSLLFPELLDYFERWPFTPSFCSRYGPQVGNILAVEVKLDVFWQTTARRASPRVRRELLFQVVNCKNNAGKLTHGEYFFAPKRIGRLLNYIIGEQSRPTRPGKRG